MDAMDFILIALTVFALRSCDHQASTTLSQAIAGSGTPSGTALLIGADLTAQASGSATITCSGNATHYKVSATQPSVSDGGWSSCSSTTLNFSLNPGDNNFKVWFKNSESVSASAQDIKVYRGSKKLVPSTEVADSYFGLITQYNNLMPERLLVMDPSNSSNVALGGAIHIYDQNRQLIKTIYGENPNENFGANNNINFATINLVETWSENLLVVSTSTPGVDSRVLMYDKNGVELRRFVGADGVAGYNASILSSRFGLVIKYDPPSINYESFLIERSTGAIVSHDYKRIMSVITLPNANIAIVFDNGAKIIDPQGNLVATHNKSVVCSNEYVLGYALANNNLVLFCEGDAGGFNLANFVALVDTSTGGEIQTFTGLSDGANLQIKMTLSNGNFLLVAKDETQGGLNNAGRAALINGTTGAVIAEVIGNAVNEQIGGSTPTEYSLRSGLVPILSPGDQGGQGTIILMDPDDGSIQRTITGANPSDNLGQSAVFLSNGDLITWSTNIDVDFTLDAGSLMILDKISGATKLQLDGDSTGDLIGLQYYSAKLLDNGNIFLMFRYWDHLGKTDVGRVVLADLATGVIKADLYGDDNYDQLGETTPFTLGNGKYAVLNRFDDVGGVPDVGSILILDGVTGTILHQFQGQTANERLGENALYLLSNGNYIIPSVNSADSLGVRTGSLKLIDRTNYSVLAELNGEDVNDFIGVELQQISAGVIGVSLPFKTINGNPQVGSVILWPIP